MKTLKIASITLMLAVVCGFIGCNKDTTCKAKIECKDSNGNAVSNAQVKLFAIVEKDHAKFRADIQAEGITDNSGIVTFSFKLPAIYDVQVAMSTKTATGIVKLEEGKTVTKEVVVK